MKNIFYILALLVTAAGGYFSWEFQRKFQEEHRQINTRYEDSERGSFNDGLLTLNERLKATIETRRKELKDEQGSLDAARKLLAERNAEIEVAESNERTLQRSLSEAEAQLEEQQAKIDELNQAVEEVKTILADQG
jgi:phage-related tail protein